MSLKKSTKGLKMGVAAEDEPLPGVVQDEPAAPCCCATSICTIALAHFSLVSATASLTSSETPEAVPLSLAFSVVG